LRGSSSTSAPPYRIIIELVRPDPAWHHHRISQARPCVARTRREGGRAAGRPEHGPLRPGAQLRRPATALWAGRSVSAGAAVQLAARCGRGRRGPRAKARTGGAKRTVDADERVRLAHCDCVVGHVGGEAQHAALDSLEGGPCIDPPAALPVAGSQQLQGGAGAQANGSREAGPALQPQPERSRQPGALPPLPRRRTGACLLPGLPAACRLVLPPRLLSSCALLPALGRSARLRSRLPLTDSRLSTRRTSVGRSSSATRSTGPARQAPSSACSLSSPVGPGGCA
jgi:hypothetical protein